MLLTNKKPDYCLDLIADAIFLDAVKPAKSTAGGRHPKHGGAAAQPPGAGATNNTLTLAQEFQLVIALCDFFSERSVPGASSTNNTMFLSLFGTGGAPSAARPRVLAKLVSTAISGRLAAVLSAAGTWMQQMGPSSGCCTQLARSIVSDFITFAAPAPAAAGASADAVAVPAAALTVLPEVAPRFTVNLITACCELYLVEPANCPAPPAALLSVFTGWLLAAPLLCVGVLQPPALPSGAIAMPMVTPLVGLIRWCVLAPLVGAAAAPDSTAAAAYSRLHLAVLQSLVHSRAHESAVSASQAPGISALHLGQVVAALKQMPRPMATDDDGGDDAADGRLQVSLERLAQSVQLGLAARAITGNVTQLFCRLEALPANPLMQIVIRANKQASL